VDVKHETVDQVDNIVYCRLGKGLSVKIAYVIDRLRLDLAQDKLHKRQLKGLYNQDR